MRRLPGGPYLGRLWAPRPSEGRGSSSQPGRGAASGLLLVAVAALLWGTTGTTFKLMSPPAPADPLLVGAVRLVVAAPVLILGALGRRQRVPRPTGQVAAAGACLAVYQVCYFSAVPLGGVAITALLAICSAPIIVALLARVWLSEGLTRERGAALALGVGGATLLVLGGSGQAAGSEFIPGAALALGAGLSYSLYAVISKGAVREAPALGQASVTFTVAAVLLLPILLSRPGETAALLRSSWPLLLYLGTVPTALAYWLFTSGLRHVAAGLATLVGLMEPLAATLLGVFLFREALGPQAMAGALLLLAAVALLAVFAQTASASQAKRTVAD